MSLDLKDIYNELFEGINEIDVLLDSVSGSKAAGKRKVISDLTSKHEAFWKDAVDTTVTQLSTLDAEQQAAAYYALVNTLRTNFDKSVTGYIDGLVDAQPKQEALISEDDVAKYSEKRS